MHAAHRTVASVALAVLTAAPAVTVAGCRRGHDRTPDATADSPDAARPAAAPAAPASTPVADGSTAPLTVSDIDRWQRGMAAELEAVRAAATQRAHATSANDSLTATAATTETATRAAGARAAGVDERRYQQLRTALSAVAGYMTPLEQQMDVSKMPEAAVAQLRQSHDEDLARAAKSLPPDVVAALRPRAAALSAQELALTAERLKAAGMGH